MSGALNSTLKVDTAITDAMRKRDISREDLAWARDEVGAAQQNMDAVKERHAAEMKVAVERMTIAVETLPRKRAAFVEKTNALHQLLDADVSGVCGSLPKVAIGQACEGVPASPDA